MLPARLLSLLPVHAVAATLQSVGRGVGGTVLSWTGHLRQDWAALGRMAQGRLQEQYFGPHGGTNAE